MAKPVSTAEYLRRTVVPVEGTIPAGMTIKEWRTQPRRPSQPGESCNHLCDTTTRYDYEKKLLDFLLICPECRTEKLIETVPYEPRFVPTAEADPAEAPVEATVHPLPLRRRWLGRPDRLRRAA